MREMRKIRGFKRKIRGFEIRANRGFERKICGFKRKIRKTRTPLNQSKDLRYGFVSFLGESCEIRLDVYRARFRPKTARIAYPKANCRRAKANCLARFTLYAARITLSLSALRH